MSIIYYSPRGSGKTYKIKQATYDDSNDLAIFVCNLHCKKSEYSCRSNVFSNVKEYIDKYKGLSDYYKPSVIYIDEYESFSEDYKKQLAELYNKEKKKFIIRTTPVRMFNVDILEIAKNYRSNKISKDVYELYKAVYPEESKEFEVLEYHFLSNPTFDYLIESKVDQGYGCIEFDLNFNKESIFINIGN